jgi:hypothetical protein
MNEVHPPAKLITAKTVILSAAKNPNTVYRIDTAKQFQPQTQTSFAKPSSYERSSSSFGRAGLQPCRKTSSQEAASAAEAMLNTMSKSNAHEVRPQRSSNAQSASS